MDAMREEEQLQKLVDPDEMELDDSEILKSEPRETVNTLYMIIVTSCAAGLQVVWCAVLSYGSPFLTSLGLPNALSALVWMFAPLCGVLVQPYVGQLSDQCQSRWGRRKPFTIGGTLGTIISMLALASTKSIVDAAAKSISLSASVAEVCTILTAIFWIFTLNVSVQPLQAGTRAFFIDVCPPHQQTEVSAWASRMNMVGNIVGYLFGTISLPEKIPLVTVSQFSGLCILASVSLGVTVLLSCSLIREKSAPGPQDSRRTPHGFWTTISKILQSAKTMPPRISMVCQVQFFAWLARFPYLYYITSYIGDLYAKPILAEASHMTSSKKSIITETSVRVGSFGSLIFAITALLTSILLPLMVRDSADSTPAKQQSILSWIARPTLRKISILRAWLLSHLLFAFAMFATIIATTDTDGFVIAGLVGLTAACTQWIPFALIGNEISEDPQNQAGVILGLHNVAISLPQIIAALVSSIIFSVAQGFGSDDSLGWVLRFGGCASILAALFTRKLEKRSRALP